jgi:hypothetical protein
LSGARVMCFYMRPYVLHLWCHSSCYYQFPWCMILAVVIKWEMLYSPFVGPCFSFSFLI